MSAGPDRVVAAHRILRVWDPAAGLDSDTDPDGHGPAGGPFRGGVDWRGRGPGLPGRFLQAGQALCLSVLQPGPGVCVCTHAHARVM